MKAYYIYEEDVQKGPLSLDELKKMRLQPNTLVWFEPMKDWEEVRNIPALQFLIAPQATVTPPTIEKNIPAQKNKLLIPLVMVSVALIAVIAYYLFAKNEQKTVVNDVTVVNTDTSNFLPSPEAQASVMTQDSIANAQGQAQAALVAQQSQIDSLNTSLKDLRNNWNQSIFVKSQEQKIENDALTSGVDSVVTFVTNNTAYLLNSVVLSLKYINVDNKDTLTNVAVRDIPAQGSKKIVFRHLNGALSAETPVIKSVTSYAFQFHFEKKFIDKDGNFTTGVSGDTEDPWRSN